MNRFFITLFGLFIFFGAVAQPDTIIVGGDYNYPPFSFINNDGKATGYDVDVIKAIAKEVGMHVEFDFTYWDTVLQNLKTKKVDVIASIVYSKEREEVFDFTFPLHTEYYAVFAPKSTNINDLPDLKGKIPAYLSGDISNESFLKPMGLLESDFKQINSLPEAFSNIKSGECDYVIAPYALGMEIINEKGFSNFEVKGPLVLPSVFCLAVHQGDFELLALLNEGIDKLSRNGKLEIIYNKWIKYKHEDDQYKQSFIYARYIILILLGVTALMAFVGWLLHMQNQQKKIRIRAAEAIYEKVFNSVEDALILLSEEGYILEANNKSQLVLGMTLSEIIGENGKKFISIERESLFVDFISNCQEQHNFEFGKFNRIVDGESVCFEVFGSKVMLGKGYAFLVIFHDVTKEDKVVKALNDAKLKAESANRTKSTFLSTVSHEIRTPLNAVMGFSNLLGGTTLTEKQFDYTQKIKSASEILFGLVSNVLDMSKIEAGKLELEQLPFLVNEMITKVIDVQLLKAEIKGIDLDLIISDNTPNVLIGDALRLSQVLLNLINNAIKFTNKGEVVVIIRPGKVVDEGQTKYHRMWFIVKDSGIGISKEKQESLFKPFMQSESSDSRMYGGTGLGLAISKNLVDLMGGELYVDSELGKGSRFSFFVDLKEAENNIEFEKINTNEDIEKGKVLKDINILLVEDNDFNAEICIEQLNSLGASVKWAFNGTKALEMMVEDCFDIILMDIEMPGLNGIETTSKIKEFKRWENIPIIALSAYGLHEEREKAIAVGMVTYLTKPISIHKLSSTIKKYTSGDNSLISSDNESIRFSAMQNFGGDKLMYERALNRFYRVYRPISDQIFELFEKGNFTQIKTIVHNLKSASATVGFEELSTESKRIDEAFKRGKNISKDEIMRLVELLNQAIKGM